MNINMQSFMDIHENIDQLRLEKDKQKVLILFHHGRIKRLFNSIKEVEFFLTSIGAIDIDFYWKCVEADTFKCS